MRKMLHSKRSQAFAGQHPSTALLLQAAPKYSSDVDLVNVHDEVNSPSDLNASKVYEQLAARVARGSVAGVISLLTSPDSPPVVCFCRTMRIPLLLANDDLMATPEDSPGVVFRMIPTNGRQACDMANWLNEQARDRPFRVALFHEPNAFGEYLQRKLNYDLLKERNKDIQLYNFEVTDQLEFADLMPQLWCESVDTIVYLGYASRGMDLLNKLKWYRADPDQVACHPKDTIRSFKKLTVLLSSGAYQEDLRDIAKYQFPFKVFAMLPTRPVRNKKLDPIQRDASETEEDTGASEYGYDSYALLKRLAKNKFKIPSRPIESSKTGHDYHFEKNGELEPADKNRYRAYLLLSSALQAKP